MINKIKQNVYQFHFKKFGSCVYLIEFPLKAKRTKSESELKGEAELRAKRTILIDTSSEENKQELLQDLKKLNIEPENINTLIITHNHYDHVGNSNLFTNAKIITNKNSQDLPKELQPIQTPGHTQDSFCILYDDILFSGDTIFHESGRGRTDLPGGNEQQILKSIQKLTKINYKILCPGHID
jgi:glyoxylase-like metal-dependent hydrolase (beta-lactamase superfamily II)